MSFRVISRSVVGPAALPLLVALVYMLPINLNIGSFSGKPIDLAISNIILVVSIFLFFGSHRLSKLAFTGLVLPFFFISIGLISALLRGGDLAVVFSALSFTIPVFHIGAGYVIGRSSMNFSFLNISFALSLVILAIFLSDIAYGSFPRGCGIEGRLGGCLGQFEVYGFPNSSMNFLAICSPMLALPFIRRSKVSWRILALFAFIALSVMVPLSLSRSALLVFSLSLGFIVMIIFGIFALFAYLSIAILLIASFQWVISLHLFSGIAARMRVALEADNLSNGRTEIWKDAISIWLESPLLGKAFVPFSEYSMFGTAHQQYLEILYKTGLLGFTFYFGYLLIVARLANRLIRSDIKRSTNDQQVFFAFGTCIFVSNLFQPSISYQPMGNFMFFALGVFLARSAANIKVTNETNPSEFIHRAVRTG
mgnify:CR=1 FL=1